jgi:hypothetical protein
MKKETKAQSGILIMVLIILIAITAIMVFWNVFFPLIKNKSGEIDSSKLTIELEIKEFDLFVNGYSKITVYRAGQGEIRELKFVFYDYLGNSHVETRTDVLDELETRTYEFTPIINFGKIKKISVVPVLGKTMGREFSSDASGIFEIPNGLVSWWRFDDLNDFAGDNNGELVGVNLNNGELEGEGYFKVLNNSGLDLNNEMAISFLINPNKNNIIFEKGDNYRAVLEGNKITFMPWNLYGEVNLNEFSHVVINVEKTGTRIYINGEADNSGNFVTLNINNGPLKIYGVNKIDEFMIFNRSLAISEISEIYNNLKK